MKKMLTEVCQQQEERAPQWPEEEVLQQYPAVSIPLGYTVSALAKGCAFWNLRFGVVQSFVTDYHAQIQALCLCAV